MQLDGAAAAPSPDGQRGLAKQLEAAHGCSVVAFAKSLGHYHPEIQAAWMPVAGGYAVYTGNTPFSLAMGVALEGPIRSSELDAIEEFYRPRGIAPSVDVCPYSHPSLLELLRIRAYRPRVFTSVLCRDLLEAPVEFCTMAPGISWRWAQPSDLDDWTELVARAFFEVEVGPLRRTTMRIMFGMPEMRHMLALVDGELAGSSCLALAEDNTAEMFGACTLPGFRCRGVHSAMLQVRLQEAKRQGCTLIVATAVPGGVSEQNLEHHSFRVAYQKSTWEKSGN